MTELKSKLPDHQSINSLFPCKNQLATFFIPSLFAMTGWRARSLYIVELLVLWDYPVVMV